MSQEYPEIPGELIGDYYRGMIERAKNQLPSCPFCGNETIYISLIESSGKTFELACCHSCQASAPKDVWQKREPMKPYELGSWRGQK